MIDPIIKKYKQGTVTVQRVDNKVVFGFWPHEPETHMELSHAQILELMRTGNAIEMQKIISDARLEPKD